MSAMKITTESIVKAGVALEAARQAVTGSALACKVGGGTPIQLKRVWDEHVIRSQVQAGADAAVVLAVIEGKLKVISPFCDAFPKAARILGGVWDGVTWDFALQEQAAVIALCHKIYGEAGEPDVQRVNLVFTVVDAWRDSSTETGIPSLYFAGRLVAKFVKNKGVFFGDGVVIQENKFTTSGRKFLGISAEVGTKFIMRDLPISVMGKGFERSCKRFSIEVEPVVAGSPVAEMYSAASEIIDLKKEVQTLQTKISAARSICNHLRRKSKEGKLTDDIGENKLQELALILASTPISA